MGNALHSFQELGRNQLVPAAVGAKPAKLATAHMPHTQLEQPQPQSRSVVRPAQPVGKLGRKARMLNELHKAIEHAKETRTELLKQIEVARGELESTRKQVEQERGNLPSEQRAQLEASLQALAQMEAEIRPRSEALDAKSRELSQRESAVSGLEREKEEVRFLEEILTRRREELVQMSAEVAKREQAVSQREQAIKDAPAEFQKQEAHLDARERALDIRQRELRQKKESLDAREATLDSKSLEFKGEVARFERKQDGLHDEITLLRKRLAELGKAKEPPRKLTGPPRDMPPAKYLDFELLPPGSWDVEDVLKHYKRMARRMPAAFAGKRPDWRRIREIQKLKPIDCYIGKKMWEGYTVYIFKRTTNVVLECPFEGNATYILDENWKREVRHTKQYVRKHYNYRKIVHKGEWLDRVHDSLYDL
jgi:hypothetical protein